MEHTRDKVLENLKRISNAPYGLLLAYADGSAAPQLDGQPPSSRPELTVIPGGDDSPQYDDGEEDIPDNVVDLNDWKSKKEAEKNDPANPDGISDAMGRKLGREPLFGMGNRDYEEDESEDDDDDSIEGPGNDMEERGPEVAEEETAAESAAAEGAETAAELAEIGEEAAVAVEATAAAPIVGVVLAIIAGFAFFVLLGSMAIGLSSGGLDNIESESSDGFSVDSDEGSTNGNYTDTTGECSIKKQFYSAGDMAKLFGTNSDSPVWKTENLINVNFLTRNYTVNKKIAACLLQAQQEMKNRGINYTISSGGGYQYRHAKPKPGVVSSSLSRHSWGIAIDINPSVTGYYNKDAYPAGFVDVMKSKGFIWGGDWRNPDAMHFEWHGLEP
ncbi:hypothetical protein A2Y26_01910 [candidate division CPR2 bacterium GWD2_39_7]|nr:MAG: hypothetical protein A2Y26_01910 [candidate division CPR2 bacterium GWD2_39_7]